MGKFPAEETARPNMKIISLESEDIIFKRDTEAARTPQNDKKLGAERKECGLDHINYLCRTGEHCPDIE